ncbi:MAG: hypothetical protein QMD96_08680 [Anaerosomatales bacterium]|nr:hypothetical protein [Anaerosomatales bacterium]
MRKALVFLTLCALLTGGLSASGADAAGAASARVQSAAAKMCGRPDPQIKFVPDAVFSGVPGLSQWIDADTGEEFVWDASGGWIRRYANPSAYAPTVEGGDIGEQRARSIADAWARRCFDPASLRSMRVTCDRREVGTDPVNVEYRVEYRRFLGDVSTFVHVAVVVNGATGAVMSVEQEQGPIAVSISPEVSQDEARVRAAELMGVPENACTSCVLEVLRYAGGVQRLAWVAKIHTGDAQFGGDALVIIDADTGAVLDSGKSW